MTETNLDALARSAQGGDRQAQFRLAQALEEKGEHTRALAVLQEAAQAGHAPAQSVLGARLLIGRGAPYSPKEGAQLIQSAAAQGHAEALSLMAVLASLSADWDRAKMLLGQAAEHGDAAASAQLALLRAFDPPSPAAGTDIQWRFDSPRVGVVEGFLPKAVCTWIVDKAKPRLERVRVNDPNSGVARSLDYRSNSGVGFSVIHTDVVMQATHARIAATMGTPVNHQEPTNVLHYAPGQEYKPHFDFVDPQVSQFARELQMMGQRVATFLIYLNDDYEGGETDFPRLGWRFKGRAGDALVFWNVDAEGKPERQTLHAGLPPVTGEKWLFSKWIRSRPVPLL